MDSDMAFFARLSGRATAVELAIAALIRVLPAEKRDELKSAIARVVEGVDDMRDYGSAMRESVKDILRYSES